MTNYIQEQRRIAIIQNQEEIEKLIKEYEDLKQDCVHNIFLNLSRRYFVIDLHQIDEHGEQLGI